MGIVHVVIDTIPFSIPFSILFMYYYYYYYYYPYCFWCHQSQSAIAGVHSQISRPHCTDCGGVKIHRVDSKCPLGPPLRVDTTCSPISPTDDFCFFFLNLGSFSAVQALYHRVARYFTKLLHVDNCTQPIVLNGKMTV